PNPIVGFCDYQGVCLWVPLQPRRQSRVWASSPGRLVAKKRRICCAGRCGRRAQARAVDRRQASSRHESLRSTTAERVSMLTKRRSFAETIDLNFTSSKSCTLSGVIGEFLTMILHFYDN